MENSNETLKLIKKKIERSKSILLKVWVFFCKSD